MNAFKPLSSGGNFFFARMKYVFFTTYWRSTVQPDVSQNSGKLET